MGMRVRVCIRLCLFLCMTLCACVFFVSVNAFDLMALNGFEGPVDHEEPHPTPTRPTHPSTHTPDSLEGSVDHEELRAVLNLALLTDTRGI